ncbi:protein tumorous imaginal discs: mitochondrial-like isoform X2 [Dinothrombium tinctorium]|uniref:DnaJ homolog l(2)tid, mitochondrial n=1 Tax=Dinothrombium tinctorium TaxID=1965070 RepID=A0A443RR99_9ACAR|nr:protein tumorous imaginal discs: mitochondrial-like isoform X2 [Dinothrombium tinctorium]
MLSLTSSSTNALSSSVGSQLLRSLSRRHLWTRSQCVLLLRDQKCSSHIPATKWTANESGVRSKQFHTSSVCRRKDYYDILGITKNASQKDIKKAYYQLAKKYHPDTNKGDPEAAKKFQEVSEAYEVLSDESKRRAYDQFGTSGPDFGSSTAGSSGFSGFHSSVDPEELFRKIFGEFGFDRFTNQNFDFAESNFGFGAAQEVILNLTFKEAARGCTKEVKVNVVDTCPRCSGSKSEPGYKPVRCTYCNGTGMETISTGPFVMRSTCRMCHGTRVYIKYPCNKCEGKGTVVGQKTAQIPVPAGVEDGQTLRMQVGKKELFITFKIAKSDYFRRDGADVHTDVTISLSQAVLGGTARIQGIDEDITIKIPPGTSSHTRMRLVGKGLKRVNSYGQGDHYVNFKIRIPQRLSRKQKALITAYAELEEETPGTINGIVDTNEGSKKYAAKEESSQESSATSLFGKIKKAIFG